jgi:hypothetical protein
VITVGAKLPLSSLLSGMPSTGDPVWAPAGSGRIYALIAGALAAVLAADFATPLGVGLWVFYFVPVVLTFLLWHPSAPLCLAAIATVCTALGYVASPLAGR